MSDNFAKDFQKWLLERYFDFQRELEHPSSVSEFAKYLNIERTVLSNLLWGKKLPSDKVLMKLNKKYSDDMNRFIAEKHNGYLKSTINHQLKGLTKEEKLQFFEALLDE